MPETTLAEVFRALPGYHDEDEGVFDRGYIGWSPRGDYLSTKDGSGWDSHLQSETWTEFAESMAKADPDLNLIADFYFSLTHDETECTACDRSGYNPATKQIADDFYDFAGRGTRWCDKITQDEVDALIEQGRLSTLTREHVPTADEVNAWGRGPGIGHDAINRWILIETRAARLGVFGRCDVCGGNGALRTGPDRIQLNIWMLHPRKGASRGWTVRSVEPSQIEEVRAFMRANFEHHRATRFSWALAATPDTTGASE